MHARFARTAIAWRPQTCGTPAALLCSLLVTKGRLISNGVFGCRCCRLCGPCRDQTGGVSTPSNFNNHKLPSHRTVGDRENRAAAAGGTTATKAHNGSKQPFGRRLSGGATSSTRRNDNALGVCNAIVDGWSTKGSSGAAPPTASRPPLCVLAPGGPAVSSGSEPQDDEDDGNGGVEDAGLLMAAESDLVSLARDCLPSSWTPEPDDVAAGVASGAFR